MILSDVEIYTILKIWQMQILIAYNRT